MGNDMVYSMANIGGKEAGGLYQMWGEQLEQGVPTHWASYVSVANVDDTVEKAESLVAAIIMQPTDVFDAGRMAAIIDPTGAVFSLWQPMKHIVAEVVNEHGALCWNELTTNDTGKAGEFYTELFGWGKDDMDMGGSIYTVFMNGDRPAAGMMAISGNKGDMPSSWSVYFAVNDCDSSVEEAQSLGGEVVVPPNDIPDVGRFSFLSYPQGAVFAVIKLIKQPD
ncbi:MAG: VOC family protein [Aliifodinibius sp.]|nr:VOC family protein [Fodinibius sp.]NIX00702.1 VOC family protein [Phycisphaerae bacterium]NIY24459.1 VOC family protein [Fodinibius sp.]